MMMANALVVCLGVIHQDVYRGLKQATFGNWNYIIPAAHRYNEAHVYALEKMKNRLIFARDNFKEGNKLSAAGKEKLKGFIRWLMNYDLNAYVQRSFLEQFVPPVLPTTEIQHLGNLIPIRNIEEFNGHLLCQKQKLII